MDDALHTESLFCVQLQLNEGLYWLDKSAVDGSQPTFVSKLLIILLELH